MGELARQPGGPALPATPLELLTPRPDEDFSKINKWTWPISGAGLGIAFWSSRNIISKKPLWTGIQYHILCGGLFAYIMIYFREMKYAAKADADEIFKHYITLHPEDFPPYERKRYRDVYKRFMPIR